jgi:hypothetical protein
VQGIVIIVQPDGIVEEGEQKYERRVGGGCLRKERDVGRSDPLPVAFAVYGRILARGPLKDGGYKPSGIRYGNAPAASRLLCFLVYEHPRS